jgi:phosphomevalonate kinase
MADLRIPGKLMLAGEYAVVRAGGRALAVAVGELVHAEVLQTGPAHVQLHAFGQTWRVEPGDEAQGLAGFTALALRWLADNQGVTLRRSVRMDVAGAIGGHKVGLGTSAAVTVATVRAVLESAGLTWAAADVASAARAIHDLAQQPAGSGYDVTTIAHGGVIAYRRTPDRAERLQWPDGLHAAALFSGTPASTGIALRRQGLPTEHLDALQQACDRLLIAWPYGARAALDGLLRCQAAFDAAATVDPHLRSEAVDSLRSLVESSGCVARTSGAGGGDCVLALSDHPERVQAAVTAWQARGGHVVARLPLDLAPVQE